MHGPRCGTASRGVPPDGAAAPASRSSTAATSGRALDELSEPPRHESRLTRRNEGAAAMGAEGGTRFGEHQCTQPRPPEVTVVAGDSAALSHPLSPFSRAPDEGNYRTVHPDFNG